MVFGSMRSRMLSNFHVSMLHVPFGRCNAQGQTHSKTFSNYLCTDGVGNWTGRRATGYGALTWADADEIAATAMRALAS
jgi:hypothetical protein